MCIIRYYNIDTTICSFIRGWVSLVVMTGFCGKLNVGSNPSLDPNIFIWSFNVIISLRGIEPLQIPYQDIILPLNHKLILRPFI